MKKNYFLETSEDLTELEGPYECPHCHGHVKLDSTFLDQVTLKVRCPYCGKVVQVPDVSVPLS